MGRRDNLIKSTANYSLRKKHQIYSEGAIYENDHLTILPDDGLYDEDRVMFSDSNFKFRTNVSSNEKKKHFRGEWATASGDSEYWTLETCQNQTTSASSDEYKIVLKPRYTSLKDFAYFGSAKELIHATVNDIALRFPGGISYYGENAPILRNEDENNEPYYLVSNEFGIDIWSIGVDESSVENPMKVYSCSYTNYVNSAGTMASPAEIEYNKCNSIGHIIATISIEGETLYLYLGKDNKHYLLTKEKDKKGIIVRPKKEYIDEFFNSLDDFEKVILNRTTKPVYKATFDTPYETDNGYLYRKESYVWPTVGDDNFTPDITTGTFGGYLERLLKLADYYDTYESDNIWRMLTHESIKNLDWTSITSRDGEVEEGIDSSRMQYILRMTGRQYDDIRRYAINIKNTNGITYNEEGNMPDYFLSDSIENKGWIAQYTGPTTDDTITETLSGVSGTGILNLITSGGTLDDGSGTSIYNTRISGYTSSDANINFLRRLSINSDYIQSMKGTKKGVETILGMFGLIKDEDYTVTEYMAYNDLLPYDEICRLYALNDDFYDESTNLLYGLPVAPLDTTGDNMPDKIAPWFDKDMEYDNGNMYFQCKGGWKEMPYKRINLNISEVSSITSTEEFMLFDETIPYMKYAETIDEMLEFSANEVEQGTICYVSDISDMPYKYANDEGIVTDAEKIANFSHYFILSSATLSSNLGYVDNDIYHCYGWANIGINEYASSSTMTNAGLQVLHIETMTQEEDGNNPHIGNGKYDEGEEYLAYYKQIFKHEIDNNLFSVVKSAVKEGDTDSINDWSAITICGFTITTSETSKKCFTLMNGNTCDYIGEPDSDDLLDDIKTYEMMNLKRMHIHFNVKDEYFKDYINKVVMKYLEEMIPSTTIWGYGFGEHTFNAHLFNTGIDSSMKKIVAAMATNKKEDILYKQIDLTKENG